MTSQKLNDETIKVADRIRTLTNESVNPRVGNQQWDDTNYFYTALEDVINVSSEILTKVCKGTLGEVVATQKPGTGAPVMAVRVSKTKMLLKPQPVQSQSPMGNKWLLFVGLFFLFFVLWSIVFGPSQMKWITTPIDKTIALAQQLITGIPNAFR